MGSEPPCESLREPALAAEVVDRAEEVVCAGGSASHPATVLAGDGSCQTVQSGLTRMLAVVFGARDDVVFQRCPSDEDAWVGPGLFSSSFRRRR